jgi:hypothetical protein
MKTEEKKRTGKTIKKCDRKTIPFFIRIYLNKPFFIFRHLKWCQTNIDYPIVKIFLSYCVAGRISVCLIALRIAKNPPDDHETIKRTRTPQGRQTILLKGKQPLSKKRKKRKRSPVRSTSYKVGFPGT